MKEGGKFGGGGGRELRINKCNQARHAASSKQARLLTCQPRLLAHLPLLATAAVEDTCFADID